MTNKVVTTHVMTKFGMLYHVRGCRREVVNHVTAHKPDDWLTLHVLSEEKGRRTFTALTGLARDIAYTVMNEHEIDMDAMSPQHEEGGIVTLGEGGIKI